MIYTVVLCTLPSKLYIVYIVYSPSPPQSSHASPSLHTTSMASKAPNHHSELSKAILQHVELGAYPEPDVASEDVPASALPNILEAIDTTREGVKVTRTHLCSPDYSHADVESRKTSVISVAIPPPISMAGSPRPKDYRLISRSPRRQQGKL